MNKARYVIRTPDILANVVGLLTKNWQAMLTNGQPIAVTIQRTNRSLEQNRRYWLLVNYTSKHWRDSTGRTYQPDVLHEFFKREFLGVTCLPNGMPMAVSSAGLAVDAFGEFMAEVEVWMAERDLMLPDER